jgi:RNA polymerase sigma-70 factor (ECF subfamily)
MSSVAVQRTADEASKLDVTEVHRVHGDFVWRTLARFGVSEVDRMDQAQEVYLVVHRRLPTYQPESALTTWLYGIARRVAAAYRRRAYRMRETPSEEPARQVSSEDTPERSLEMTEARSQLDSILDRMTLDQRAVFVMFEIDGLSGREIADLIGSPLQTVFSRLRRARAIFDREVERLRTIEAREGRP